MSRPRIAVIGSGIAGLGAAHRLAPHCEVTVFEADARPGAEEPAIAVAGILLAAAGSLLSAIGQRCPSVSASASPGM